MKKVCLILLLFLLSVIHTAANTRISATLSKCTDGDTAHFLIDGADRTVRFLAVDTPEYTKEKEPYGKEASEFTCRALENAQVIELEYDEGSGRQDKYGRELAWVFVDGELLQKQLVAEGLAEVAYIYGDYEYTDELMDIQEQAKQRKVNIWSGTATEAAPFYLYIVTAVGVVLIMLLSVSNVKGKKAKINKVKRTMKQFTKR